MSNKLQLNVNVARPRTELKCSTIHTGNIRRNYCAQILDFYGMPHPAHWKEGEVEAPTPKQDKYTEISDWVKTLEEVSVKDISERFSTKRVETEKILARLEQGGVLTPAVPFQKRKVLVRNEGSVEIIKVQV